MNTEKQNIIRDKLNELNEVPEGFLFDHEMTWKRLDMRLVSDSQKKRLYWLNVPALLFKRLIHEISKMFAVQEGNKIRRRRRNTKGSHPKPLRVFTMQKKRKQ